LIDVIAVSGNRNNIGIRVLRCPNVSDHFPEVLGQVVDVAAQEDRFDLKVGRRDPILECPQVEKAQQVRVVIGVGVEGDWAHRLQPTYMKRPEE
jgi:hypothetical protein